MGGGGILVMVMFNFWALKTHCLGMLNGVLCFSPFFF